MAGSGFFEYLDKTITTQLHQVTQGQSVIYASGVSTLANAAISLFILVKGYQAISGKLQTPVNDVVWELSKMAIIMMFVNNVNGYLDLAIGAINGLKEGFSGSENVWSLLDQLWQKTQDLGTAIYQLDDSTYVKAEGSIGEFLLYIGSMVTMIIATIVNLSAEVTILFMTVTAPLFIFCLMWGFLRQMFNNWLQIIFSAILTVLFASLVVRVSMSFLQAIFDQLSAQATQSNLVVMGAMACVAGIVSGVFVWLASKFASQLAGVGVEGAIQGMAAVGLGAAGFGAMKAARGAAGSIGGRAQENLSSNREKPAAASGASSSGEQMKRRTQAVTQRMRSQAGHYK